ncbi:TetR/AcrR family transcriptional regulator, transcriptional repressor for nem operon [Pararobbsia alpina]|uniref:TetR/AcrR family transcriptional regulator n=1 Tax=Pararobbsia alpina TaxID=621374 RepID=UPI0039A47878
MARPKEFDEPGALDAALLHFWTHGYEASSVRDLAGAMQITSASLYNTFGDKRALFARTLHYYIEQTYAEPVRRFSKLPAREAIKHFLGEIVERSLTDHERKGCMVVNSALELAPHDSEFREVVSKVLVDVETFFRRSIAAGQRDGTIAASMPTDDLARLLLSVFLGLRVLARTRPERKLLEGLVRAALTMLDGRVAV